MIDSNMLNSHLKEFPKEVNECKYIISIFNDVRNHFNILRSSIEIEGRGLDSFFKANILHSKNFMSDMSALNFYENDQTPENDTDNTNLINISMSFGNQFDILGKIFFDEYEEFNIKINKNIQEFNEEINAVYKYLSENINLSFKELSSQRAKYKSTYHKNEKIFKEFEIQQKKEDKISDKLISVFSDFEDNYSQLKFLADELKKLEIWNDETLNNMFINILKLTIKSLIYFKDNFIIITHFKAELLDKIVKTLVVTLESIDSLNINGSNLNLLSTDIEIKNIAEISENFNKNLNTQIQSISFKKKMLVIFSKFISELSKCSENLISFFQKQGKLLYNSKQESNKSFSYLNSTSVSQIFDFLKSVFDLFIKKIGEINKHTTNTLSITIETMGKDLTNEENIFSNLNSKFQKEFQNYKNSQSKQFVNKEKVINQIVNIKNSEDTNKFESKMSGLKSEEFNINEVINEQNIKFKKYLEDLISNFNKSYILPSKDVRKFSDAYRDGMLIFITQIEKIYSQLSDYISFKDQIILKNSDPNVNRTDLRNIVETFVKEYMFLSEPEKYEDFINFSYDMILNISNAYKIDDSTRNSKISLFNENFNENIQSPVIENENENSIFYNKFIKSSEYQFLFLNKDDILSLQTNIDFKKEIEKLMKPEEFGNLMQKYLANLKSKTSRKSTMIEPKIPITLDEEESVVESFNCSYYDKYLFLLGRLYLTNKKIIYESKMYNNNSANNKSFIEINKKDIIYIKILNGSVVKIKPRYPETLGFYFLFSYAPNLVLEKIKETFKVDDLNNIHIEPEENYETVNTVRSININDAEYLINRINELQDRNGNELQPEISDKLIKSCEDPIIFEDSQESLQMLNEIQFFEKLNEFNTKRLEFFNEKNLIRKDFNSTFINGAKVSKSTEVPMCLIYKYIYDNDTICRTLNFNKNFINSLQELNKDYNISFNYMNMQQVQDEGENKNYKKFIPKYYLKPIEYTLPLFSNLDRNELIHFLSDLKTSFSENNTLLYQYKYTHPMKKVFMGPSKLDMNDEYKIFFISPLCFIVEIYTYISGFMLMDTFFTVAQYKYESELSWDATCQRICYNTKVTASFAIEFVKDNWFRNKIESNGMVDNEISIRDFVLVNIAKVLTDKSEEYHEIEKKVKSKKSVKKKELPISSDLPNIIDKNLQNLNEENIKREVLNTISNLVEQPILETKSNTIIQYESTQQNKNSISIFDRIYFIYLVSFIFICKFFKFSLGEFFSEIIEYTFYGITLISLYLLFKRQEEILNKIDKLK